MHNTFLSALTLSYTIVLCGLLRKHAYPLALEVWERYRSCKHRLDYVDFGIGVEVLAFAGHPDQVLALLESLVAVYRPCWSHCLAQTGRLYVATRTKVPASVVGRFMRALSFTNPSAGRVKLS